MLKITGISWVDFHALGLCIQEEKMMTCGFACTKIRGERCPAKSGSIGSFVTNPACSAMLAGFCFSWA